MLAGLPSSSRHHASIAMSVHYKRYQPDWAPYESKAFAAGITCMIVVPIAIAIVMACRRHPRNPNPNPRTPHDPEDDADDPTEGSHWKRIIGRRLRNRYRSVRRKEKPPWLTWLSRRIYMQSGDRNDHYLETLEDRGIARPAGETPNSSPSSGSIGSPRAGPADRRSSIRTAMTSRHHPTMQRTIPPSGGPMGGPLGSGFPNIGGGLMGAGAFVAPSAVAYSRPSISAGPAIPGGSRRTSRASRALRPDWSDGSTNENVPLAMPLRTSRPCRRAPGSSRRIVSAPPRSRTARDSNRPAPASARDRRDQATDLLSSLQERPRAPRNTEADDREIRSPPPGPQSDDPFASTRRRHMSSVDYMRRTRAMNEVILDTQNFIGGYPDIACLISELPQAGEAVAGERRERRRKARTWHI